MGGGYVARIGRDIAIELCVKYHYMHRVSPCSRAYGLIRENNIVGVCIYGVPPSSTLLKGVCGDDEMYNVYELNRLWVSDDEPRNAESFLVGNSIRDLDREIIVSFSDTKAGHVGYIYQATNFIYCGLSAEFKDPIVKGFEGMHHATYAHGMSKREIIETYGEDRVTYVDRPRKHRYVYFNAKGKRWKQLRSKLKYEQLPYPKGDTRRHTIDEAFDY